MSLPSEMHCARSSSTASRSSESARHRFSALPQLVSPAESPRMQTDTSRRLKGMPRPPIRANLVHEERNEPPLQPCGNVGACW